MMLHQFCQRPGNEKELMFFPQLRCLSPAALHWAAVNGKVEAVHLLIKSRAPSPRPLGRTAIPPGIVVGQVSEANSTTVFGPPRP